VPDARITKLLVLGVQHSNIQRSASSAQLKLQRPKHPSNSEHHYYPFLLLIEPFRKKKSRLKCPIAVPGALLRFFEEFRCTLHCGADTSK
jgi:hypothetical protein